MKKKRTGAIVRRLGPLGVSVAAAAITAAGFAAISLAAKDDTGNENRPKEAGFHVAIGPPGPLGENLSDEDRQKLEDFRTCLEEQGVEPPARPKFDPENPPEPPSRKEMERMREQMEKAHEACKDKLPEDLQNVPGPIGGLGCGPGGPPPARNERGEGDGENQSEGFVVPAPAPSGTS